MANFCSEQMGSKWLVVKGREKEPKASQTAHKVPKLVLWSTAVSTAVSGWMSNGPDVSGHTRARLWPNQDLSPNASTLESRGNGNRSRRKREVDPVSLQTCKVKERVDVMIPFTCMYVCMYVCTYVVAGRYLPGR